MSIYWLLTLYLLVKQLLQINQIGGLAGSDSSGARLLFISLKSFTLVRAA